MKSTHSLVAVLVMTAAGCSQHNTQNDSGTSDSGTPDTGRSDSGSKSPVDVNTIDVNTIDTGGPGNMDASAIADADPIGVDTPVVMPDSSACATGQAMCPLTPFNNEPVSNFTCQALINGACPAPDLIVFRDLLVDDGDGNSLGMTVQNFLPTDAEVVEGCNQAGMRRLLRFNFAAANVGTVNMNVGRPDERDTVHWEFFTAHQHWHIKGWGDYRVRSLVDGHEVGYGHKQSFCVEDNIRTSDMSGPRQFPPPLCENFDPHETYAERPDFGLSIGWGDEYPSTVRCQWVDIGDPTPGAPSYVPDGIYDLVVTVNQTMNGQHLYRENNYDNNSVHVRVQIAGSTAQACTDNAGDACTGGHVRCDGSCG